MRMTVVCGADIPAVMLNNMLRRDRKARLGKPHDLEPAFQIMCQEDSHG